MQFKNYGQHKVFRHTVENDRNRTDRMNKSPRLVYCQKTKTIQIKQTKPKYNHSMQKHTILLLFTNNNNVIDINIDHYWHTPDSYQWRWWWHCGSNFYNDRLIFCTSPTEGNIYSSDFLKIYLCNRWMWLIFNPIWYTILYVQICNVK